MKNINVIVSLFFLLLVGSTILKANSLESIKKKELIEKMSKSEHVIAYIDNSIEFTKLMVLSKSEVSKNKVFQKIKVLNILDQKIELHNKYYALVLEEFKILNNLNAVEKKEIMKGLIEYRTITKPKAVKATVIDCIWSGYNVMKKVLELSFDEELAFIVCISAFIMGDLVAEIASEGALTPEIYLLLNEEMTTCSELAVNLGGELTEVDEMLVEWAVDDFAKEFYNCF